MTLVAASAALTGCTSLVPGDPSPPPSTTAYAHPTGADDVLLAVTTGGGLAPVSIALRQNPSFVLLGDGTAIAAVTDQYQGATGPAVQRFAQVDLGESGLQQLYRRAATAGLLDGAQDFGLPQVTDSPETTVLVTVDGAVLEQSAYALSYTDGDADLSTAQQQRRQALRDFIAYTDALAVEMTTAWTPTTVAVHRVGPYGAGDAARPWPAGVPVPPDTGSSYDDCVAVTGPELAALLAVAQDATTETGWDLGAGAEEVVLRPVLPGTPQCP